MNSMLRHDYPGQTCSIASSLEVIGERWSLLIIRDILRGNRRFDQLQESLGIARNVLTSRLGRLADEGLLERRAYQERPARYEYFLTEKGLDLWPVLVGLVKWGDKHSPQPDGPPMLILHRGECGGEIDDRRVCNRCGKPLEIREAIAVPGPGSPTAPPANRDGAVASSAYRDRS